MSNWREEVQVLECGCKIGRSANGMWFYDFICDKHIADTQEDGHYSYDKALLMTEKMNKEMKQKEKEEKEWEPDNDQVCTIEESLKRQKEKKKNARKEKEQQE